MFQVTISLGITKEGEKFSDLTQIYHNMDYSDIVLVERALAEAVLQLGEERVKGSK